MSKKLRESQPRDRSYQQKVERNRNGLVFTLIPREHEDLLSRIDPTFKTGMGKPVWLPRIGRAKPIELCVSESE